MELRNVLDYDNLHDEFLGFKNRQEKLAKEVKSIKQSTSVDEYIQLMEDMLNESKKIIEHLAHVKEKKKLREKQELILMRKIQEKGKATEAISYFTIHNHTNKLLYVKCKLDGKELHISLDYLKDLYFDKRLTTPDLLIECRNYSELEKAALNKNIIIGG